MSGLESGLQYNRRIEQTLMQTYQVSRIKHKTHSFECQLTLSRKQSPNRTYPTLQRLSSNSVEEIIN